MGTDPNYFQAIHFDIYVKLAALISSIEPCHNSNVEQH